MSGVGQAFKNRWTVLLAMPETTAEAEVLRASDADDADEQRERDGDDWILEDAKARLGQGMPQPLGTMMTKLDCRYGQRKQSTPDNANGEVVLTIEAQDAKGTLFGLAAVTEVLSNVAGDATAPFVQRVAARLCGGDGAALPASVPQGQYSFDGERKNAAFKHTRSFDDGGFGWIVGVGIDNDDIFRSVGELRALLTRLLDVDGSDAM